MELTIFGRLLLKPPTVDQQTFTRYKRVLFPRFADPLWVAFAAPLVCEYSCVTYSFIRNYLKSFPHKELDIQNYCIRSIIFFDKLYGKQYH